MVEVTQTFLQCIYIATKQHVISPVVNGKERMHGAMRLLGTILLINSCTIYSLAILGILKTNS